MSRPHIDPENSYVRCRAHLSLMALRSGQTGRAAKLAALAAAGTSSRSLSGNMLWRVATSMLVHMGFSNDDTHLGPLGRSAVGVETLLELVLDTHNAPVEACKPDGYLPLN